MTRNHSLLTLTLLATGVHALIFLVTALYLIYFGKNDIAAVSWSLTFYYENASKVMAGMVPYRDFPFEYPILSFPLFLIPRLLVSDLGSYKVAFVVEMLAFDAAAIYLIARFVRDQEGLERVPGRLGWYTLFCACLSPLVIGRFELAPMVLAFAAACWWFSGRGALGGITAGLGTLMKVFPGVVAALALVWEMSRLGTRSLAPSGEGGGRRPGEGAGEARRVSPDPAAEPTGRSPARCSVAPPPTLMRGARNRGLSRHPGGRTGHLVWRGRPARVGVAGIPTPSAWPGSSVALRGRPVPLGNDRGDGGPLGLQLATARFNAAPEGGGRAGRGFALPVQAATLLLVMARFWRSGMTEGMRFSAAAVVAFIITGKVLSPQYLIWLFPFLAVLDGPTGSLARRLFLLGCLSTAMLYPGPGFVMVLNHQAGAILLLNLRNVLLVWLLALLLFGPREL